MSESTLDYLLTDATIATMASDGYGLIERGAIGILGERLAFVGNGDNAPDAHIVESAYGALVTPALIDCHTHLVHGGNRAKEFEMRLNGATYEQIARAGGGILSTVTATRDASENDLVESALKRLDHLLAEGLGTVEIKSGYGLTLEDELKMLRAAKVLGTERHVRVVTTLLAAHAVPPEYKGRADDYITHICNDILPAVHAEGLVDAVDGFCENIAFTPAQIARMFDAARALGLPVKLHAEQLTDSGGAIMAAQYGALSVDHLEYLKPEDAAILAQAGTVAVMLPVAFYVLRETQLPPIDALRKAGVPMALASDNNPGSSPVTSLFLIMNMACTLFAMTPQEALAGCTIHGARALGLQKDLGSIEVGKLADLAIWDAQEPAELAYRLGYNPLTKRIIGGKIV